MTLAVLLGLDIRTSDILGEAEDNDIESLDWRYQMFVQALQAGGLTRLLSLRMLEVGSGNGEFLSHLRGRGLNIIGVEVRARGSTEGVVAARIECLPFGDAVFDAVFSSLVFDRGVYHQDQKAMIAEITRVLSVNGVYISRGNQMRVRANGLSLAKRFTGKVSSKVYRKKFDHTS